MLHRHLPGLRVHISDNMGQMCFTQLNFIKDNIYLIELKTPDTSSKKIRVNSITWMTDLPDASHYVQHSTLSVSLIKHLSKATYGTIAIRRRTLLPSALDGLKYRLTIYRQRADCFI